MSVRADLRLSILMVKFTRGTQDSYNSLISQWVSASVDQVFILYVIVIRDTCRDPQTLFIPEKVQMHN